MTPAGLLVVLETAADESRTLELPDDPFELDALYHAAMGASHETLALARRVAAAQRVGRWRRRDT